MALSSGEDLFDGIEDRGCRAAGPAGLPPTVSMAWRVRWRPCARNLPMIGSPARHCWTQEEQTTERYAHLDRHWVREGVIRISESLAADVLTGYTGRPRTVREDTRGGAAGSLLAFPAQFRGVAAGNTGDRQRAVAAGSKIRLHGCRPARAPVRAERDTLPDRSHRTGRFASCPAPLPASPVSRESVSATRRRRSIPLRNSARCSASISGSSVTTARASRSAATRCASSSSTSRRG